MKTEISRVTFDKNKHYSGVYQQQGRMITDADWNEQTELSKQRLDQTGNETIVSGSPRHGGILDRSVTPPVLRWGTIYAGGVRAEIRPATLSEDGTEPPFSYENQKDFPACPALPEDGNYTLYADVWERTVVALEDETLVDYGLHGADTCSRTRTMVQLKWCPPGVNPENLPMRNPSKGDASLFITERGESTGSDPCDPCAREVALDAEIGNALFRLEVHSVEGDAGAPSRVVLKWSSENGAEAHAVGNEPPGFAGGKWIYEFFDETSEMHMGVSLATTDPAPRRGVLATGGYPASTAGLPTWVRRWDGCCDLKVGAGGGTASINFARHLGATIAPVFSEGFLTIPLDRLELRLMIDGRKFVAGDYWLAVIRERAPEGQRVSLSSEMPHGIEHRYVHLLAHGGSGYLPLSDAETRKLSFPPISDLQAPDIGIKPCSGNFPGAKNLQQALDALCSLDAAGIRFDNHCPKLYGDASNVRDALNHLCGVLPDELLSIGKIFVYVKNKAITGDASFTLNALLDGIRVQCDATIDVDAANGRNCTLSFELPFPLSKMEKTDWESDTIAHRPFTMPAIVRGMNRNVYITPDRRTLEWLKKTVFGKSFPVVWDTTTLPFAINLGGIMLTDGNSCSAHIADIPVREDLLYLSVSFPENHPPLKGIVYNWRDAGDFSLLFHIKTYHPGGSSNDYLYSVKVNRGEVSAVSIVGSLRNIRDTSAALDFTVKSGERLLVSAPPFNNLEIDERLEPGTRVGVLISKYDPFPARLGLHTVYPHFTEILSPEGKTNVFDPYRGTRIAGTLTVDLPSVLTGEAPATTVFRRSRGEFKAKFWLLSDKHLFPYYPYYYLVDTGIEDFSGIGGGLI